MRNLESLTQRAYFQWARRHPIAKHAFAIPNGGKRDRITAAILKGEGVLAGVPDVALPVPAGNCHGLWIEFKSADGRLSDNQKEYSAWLASQGHHVAVCYSATAGIDATKAYLGGTLCPGISTLKGG